MALVFTTKNAVLLGLETALKTISDIAGVDRKAIGVEEYEGDKGCFLADVRELRKTVLKDCIVVTYTAQVVVWVYNEEPDADLSGDLNLLIEEVKSALQNYFTLEGIVYKVIISQVDTDAGFEWPKAYGTFTLDILFLSGV